MKKILSGKARTLPDLLLVGRTENVFDGFNRER